MPKPKAAQALKALKKYGSPARAKGALRFFKTAPGQYGYKDQFIGVSVPETRALVKEYESLALGELKILLKSPWHEARLLALLVLVKRFSRADFKERTALFKFYLRHKKAINNWDLVDVTCPKIFGAYLFETYPKHQPLVDRLIASPVLWDRRLAILASFYFIQKNQFELTLSLTKRLLAQSEAHDLMHKASGWMLREIGKRDQKVLEAFLIEHQLKMPRTMLRYAIERLGGARRQAYLKGKAR